MAIFSIFQSKVESFLEIEPKKRKQNHKMGSKKWCVGQFIFTQAIHQTSSILKNGYNFSSVAESTDGFSPIKTSLTWEFRC